MDPTESALRRKQLVEYMKTSGAISSAAVEKAFLKIRRENFMPDTIKPLAYVDQAMPIGFGQTISQPSTIAIMLELLEAKEGEKILEVGSGCGYALALLSELAGKKGQMSGVERLKELAEISRKNLSIAGIENIEIELADGSNGLPGKAPFNRILVSAGCPFIPKPLFDQLKEKGRIVAPIGDKYTQMMAAISKNKGKMLKQEYLKSCFAFVPLRGEHGWDAVK